MSKKYIMIFFFIFIIVYFLSSLFKNQIDSNIELTKYNIINQNIDSLTKNKLVVYQNNNEKIIYEFSNVDLDNKRIDSVKIHKFRENIFENSISSENILYDNNSIVLYNPTLITFENITQFNGKYSYELKFLKKALISSDEVIYLDNIYYESLSYNNIIKLLNLIILLSIISIVFISKRIIKSNLITFIYASFCLVLLIYNFMISFINVQFYGLTFTLLAIFVNLLTLIYFYLND